MMNWTKWKEVFKNRKFCILLAAELLLAILCVTSMFKRQVTVMPPVDGTPFHLEAGTYMVQITYTTSQDTNVFVLEDTVDGTKAVRFGNITLGRGDNEENCELWVLRDTDHVTAYAINGGDAALNISQLKIITTSADSRIMLFLILICSALFDTLFIFYWYDRKYGISLQNKLVWSVLGVAFVLMSVPCMVDYNLWGDDWGFHVLRVEGLISGFRDGQFPVRIQGNWLGGYGYAASVFYSDLFLLIPALFRVIGFAVSASYNMFLIVINLATLMIAYQCFRRIFKDQWAGTVSAVLYCVSAYRIHDIYVRAAIGEALAMTFLPLIFYGFYQIFTGDRSRRGYRYSWLPVTLGLTGVIQSHVLTCEMLAFCILLLCLVLIRKVFIKETFWELCKAAVMTLLWNLWYLVPFLDYYLNEKFNVGHLETMAFPWIQVRGIFPAHLLFIFYGGGTKADMEVFGMNWTGAFSVGAALMLVVLAWVYLEFAARIGKSDFAGRKLGRLAFCYTLMAFVLTSSYFPWDWLQSRSKFLEMLITSLQFPYRFLAIACLSASVLAGVLLLYLRERGSVVTFGQALTGLLILALFFHVYQIDDLLSSHGIVRVYNKQSMGTAYVSNGEYLPYQADTSLMYRNRVIEGEGVNVMGYEKAADTLRMKMSVINGGAESYVELPVLYYRGYTAKDLNTGQSLQVEAGGNSAVRVLLPAGYSGEFQLSFQEPVYWRAAEVISLAAIGGGIGIFLKRRKRRVICYEEAKS